MSPRLLHFYFPLCLCFALALLTLPVFAVPRYSVTDLGILPGGKYVHVTGINNQGQVVGWVKAAHIRTRGFLWTGTLRDLGTIPIFRNCKAFGINDHSQIVGQDQTDQVGPMYAFSGHSFVWQSGKRTYLPDVNPNQDFPKGMDMAAAAINNKGQVAGSIGYLWQPSGLTRVGLCSTGINNSGQVIGGELTAYAGGIPEVVAGSHPFLWRSGITSEIGSTSGTESSEATGINVHGQVAGWTDSFPSPPGIVDEYSFFWNGSRLTRLRELKGYSSSRAYGINACGQVVGKCVRHRGYAHAYCWQNGVMRDLNNFIPKRTVWILEAAYGINNRGQIIGIGTHGRTHFRAFLLTPKS